MKLGIGSGSTVVYVVERLNERVKKENLHIVCIPTSFQSKKLIIQAKLPLGDPSTHPILDLAIDGTDEADRNLNLIKGGGAAHLQEKIVAFMAKKFIVVADYRKMSDCLGTKWKGVPLEIFPFALDPILITLTNMGGKPEVRLCSSGKAGPIVTDNGNFVIDCDFGGIHNPKELNAKLLQIPGLIETGLFCDMAEMAYFGLQNGEIEKRKKKNEKKKKGDHNTLKREKNLLPFCKTKKKF